MDTENLKEVEVIALYHQDGTIVPEMLVIGKTRYAVEKVLRVTPMNTTKTGGEVWRYEVLVDERRNTLFLEETRSYTANRKWLMEV